MIILFFCVPSDLGLWTTSRRDHEANNNKTDRQSKKKDVAFGGTRTHALKEDYDLNVAP